MKLAVLGGGGVRSPFLAKSLALAAEDIGLDTVVFMDTDTEKLYKYGKIAEKIMGLIAPGVSFSLTDSARSALTDADYIITTIRAMGDEGRVIDERTALNMGVLGQETTGAGGFAMAMRSIPVLRDYCELIKEVSKKDALIFNFTNPSGLCSQALHTMGYNNVYGVCDAPSNFFRQLKNMLGAEEFTGECFGLNHLSWFYDFKADGKKADEAVLNNPMLYKDTEMRLFNPDIISMCGNFLPNEYLYFYYFRDKAVGSINSGAKTRGETILEINKHMLRELKNIDIDKDFPAAFRCFTEHYAMRENSYFSIECGEQRKDLFEVPTVEEFINQPENGSYAGVAIDFIKARQTGREVNMVMSVPNKGAIPFLADDDVCELSCTVGKDYVIPHKAPPNIPEGIKNLILTVKNYENLTVEAIMEKNRRKAAEALMLHPLVCSYNLAKKLTDAYLEAYKDYVGEWK